MRFDVDLSKFTYGELEEAQTDETNHKANILMARFAKKDNGEAMTYDEFVAYCRALPYADYLSMCDDFLAALGSARLNRKR